MKSTLLVLAATTLSLAQPPMHGPGPGHLRVVTGAPYSAQITTSSTQTLGDGSHISRNSTEHVARDGQGRTWRQVGEGDKAMVFVQDPVAHRSHVASASDKTVRISQMPEFDRGPRRPDGPPAPPDGPRPVRRREGESIETLAPQNVEGVWAEGTRVTRTIPVNQIGNDRELKIVSETWYSKELQMVVLSKHSDPRTGEDTVRMTNIQRGEPDSSLFQAPAGYRVVERGRRGQN